MAASLYLISPPHIPGVPEFAEELEAALKTGLVATFQLRLKEVDEAEATRIARALLPICHRYEVPFIMNDFVGAAKAVGADGIHLGQEDLESTTVADARKALGDEAVIGVTCHASIHLAMEAGEDGADYVAFGAFYPTTSKPKEKLEKWGTPEPEILTRWSEQADLPCVAIGGITPQNAKPLVEAGADFIAVITAVWNHPQGAAAGVKAFEDLLTSARAA